MEQTRLLYRDYWVRIATMSSTQFDSIFFSQISDGEGVIGEVVGPEGGGGKVEINLCGQIPPFPLPLIPPL